jgi:membrane-bound lytic murein transglycosylase D
MSHEYFFTKNSTMKTTLTKQIGLLSMMVFFLSQSYTQSQNELLFPYLLHDTLTTKTTTNNNNNIVSIIPLQSNVQKHVDRYLDENEESLELIKEQKGATLKTIQQILEKRGIPGGLKYLAIVESELKNSATSKVGAAGIWQLMPETARYLGLKVNGKTDQRRHTYHSSVAAANYLKALYKEFDDWLLVVAAYNCGAGNVYKAIKQSGSREFWKLQRFLPAETRNHVKHFIATHYYYEANGSLVTLTRTERMQYLASLNEKVIKEEVHQPSNSPASSNQPSNAIMIAEQEGDLRFEFRR